MYECFADTLETWKSCSSSLPTKFSFFDLVDSIRKNSSEEIPPDPLYRLGSLMRKMKVGSYLSETLILNKELLDELAMARKALRNSNIKISAKRITFFSCAPSGQWHEFTDEWLSKHVLGYAVIATLIFSPRKHRSYLLEAVIRPPFIQLNSESSQDAIQREPVSNYYIHSIRQFNTTIGTEACGRNLTFPGTFFSQQNRLTSFCAHAALRMAINSSPLFDLAKMTNKDINDRLERPIADFKKKRGLEIEELSKVGREFVNGSEVIIADLENRPSLEYDHYLYPLMESECPVILEIKGWNVRTTPQQIVSHALSVVGHTLNSDRWEPEARNGYGSYPLQAYIPCAQWCDHLIINDDNYGMYLTLPSDMIRNFILPCKNTRLHADKIWSLAPDKINLSGYYAERASVAMAKRMIDDIKIKEQLIWLDRIKKGVKNLVCRTLLTKKSNYIAHINELAATENVFLSRKQQDNFELLPDWIWVSEFSLPHIYTGNKHKLGEVVLRAKIGDGPFSYPDNFLLAWFPGYIRFSTDKPMSWFIHGHVPFIRSYDSSPMEW